jgi:hypothetical protein
MTTVLCSILTFGLSLSVLSGCVSIYLLGKSFGRIPLLEARLTLVELRLLRFVQEHDGSQTCYPKGTLDS